MFKIKDMNKKQAEIEWEGEVWRTPSRSANTDLMKINLNGSKINKGNIDTVNIGCWSFNHKWPYTSAVFQRYRCTIRLPVPYECNIQTFTGQCHFTETPVLPWHTLEQQAAYNSSVT